MPCGAPRALARQLARAGAQIERSRGYRRSLRRVLELGRALQAVLEPTQRERWLALEEALLDHSSRLYRAYFRAGLRAGLKRGARQHRSALRSAAPLARAAPSPAGDPALGRDGLDVEVVLALLRWLRLRA